MNAFIYYSVIYLLEAYILWYYAGNMFTLRFRGRFAAFTILPLYALSALTIPFQNILVNLLTVCLVHFIYLLLFRIKWYSALFHAVITTSIMSLCELIIGAIVPGELYDFYAETAQTLLILLPALLSKLFYFTVLLTISHYYGKDKEPLVTAHKGISLFIVVPAITLWIIGTFSILSLNVDFNQPAKYMISVSALLLLLVNILVFRIYRLNLRKEKDYLEMQLQLQKESDTTEYFSQLIKEHENQSILIHDTKKHLQALASLNARDAREQIAEYIDSLLNSSALKSSARVSDHDLLNAIINRYTQYCTDKKISLHADIRSKCLYFMKDEDITAVFCNLLDNACEAAFNQPEAFIDLFISHKADTDFTFVTMINSCSKSPFDAKGNLLTHKPNKHFHGFGMKSVKRIAEKYNGEMTCYFEADTHTFHTVLMLQNVAKKVERV